MAQKQLLQLPKTQFSGLEYSNILEDVYNLIRENPDYNENWNDFLSSDAGVMITEIFAWITDQLATRIDWVVNENFIGTATQRSSIINLLKLIGYKFALPASAEVPVSINFKEAVGNYYLTHAYDPNIGTFFPKTLTAKDKKGNVKYFEAIDYDSVTNKYLYDIDIMLDTASSRSFTVNFYEGQTKIENFLSTTNQGQVFPLSENPVVRHSIKVTLLSIDGGTGNTTEIELLEVDSFLNLKAQKTTNADGSTNEIPYVVNVLENDAVEITFGTSSLLADPERRLSEGSTIRVFYRIGGGLDGEISRGAINFTEDIENNGVLTSVNYKNNTEGVGAEDSETIEHAAYVGPLQIKTAGKTVTEEDYDIILSSFINVLLSKAYGHNNIPEDYYAKYGYYISPLEVLNFVLMKKSGWEEIPTSKYKYSNWGTFNLENYFNEIISFNQGSFGNKITVNNNTNLTLSGIYDYDNQGGRVFYNYTVLSTPQKFKDVLWIDDPINEGEYIANADIKASLTYDEYDNSVHQKLEDIDDHFVANDDDNDPFFYGNLNGTNLPTEELAEDINAYFISKKNTAVGVYIGTDHLNDPNLLVLNIDGHGDVIIDLSLYGINSGVVPLEGINGVIDIINNRLAEEYNHVYSYQDFGVLIPDTTAIIETLEDHDYDLWQLRVSETDYDVNLGSTQTYDTLLTFMNNAFRAAGSYSSHSFNDSADWTVVNLEQYDFNLTINGVGPVNITLDPVSGTTLTAENLIDLLNLAFINNSIEANASLSGTQVKVSTNETGALTDLLISSGTNNDLLVITGAMDTQVAGTGVAGANLVATFVQSEVNIACYDVRISRTNTLGTVQLADSGTSTDILAAYGALPLTTIPVDYGDYDHVASIHDYGGEEKYIKLLSPTSGKNSAVLIKQYFETDRDATAAAFGLDYNSDNVDQYKNYGQRKLTIIFKDIGESDFGDFIYENGTIHFNEDDEKYIYLNYLQSKNDSIKLGYYYTDNFEETDPEWKLPAHRLYNTIYMDDEEKENAEKIDYDVSEFVIKFTRNEINDNSIYVINEDMTLVQTSYPTIESIVLTDSIDYNGKYIKISINSNTFKKIDISSVNSPSELVTILNTNFNDEAKASSETEFNFATLVDNGVDNKTIILKIDDKTKTGKIIIYDDEIDLVGAEIWNTTADENTTIFPSGDFYLDHFQPQFDSNPPLTEEEIEELTPEELFGYFEMKIIPESENNIPDLDFYVHLVNDRRHIFKDETVYRVHTDEDDLIELLQPYKIAGIDNSFKKPVFSTFDVQANVYITTAASKEQVKQNVENTLREFYSLANTTLSKSVNKSEFIGLVLNVLGVRYINITYFGHNILDESEGSNQELEIEADFDELLVLSDDVFDAYGSQLHGLLLQYNTL